MVGPRIQILVERRADVNQRDRLGRTAIHIALSGHAKLDLAKQLKTLGADPFAEDADGLTPSQIILRRLSKPQQAADFEDRPMNEVSGGSFPDALTTPMVSVVEVRHRRAKRYSELRDDLVLPCPPEGFTLKDLLTKIYEYYQAPFDEGQLRRIRQHYGESQPLGSGYIRANVNPEEDDGDAPEDAENPTKKQRVPRLSLRGVGEWRHLALPGDSIFFEGFHGCKYFEDEMVHFLLQGVIITDTLEQAKQTSYVDAKKKSLMPRVVTLDGEVIAPNGNM
ncbi:pyx, partial [Symbiodinium microadriaticum]